MGVEGHRLEREEASAQAMPIPYLRDLNAETVRVEWFGETHRAWFDGEWVCGEAVFCEKYRLSVGDDFIEIDAESLYDEDQGLFIGPRGDASGLVVGQASSYHDEWDSYNESLKEADEWSFHNFVVANTSPDPAKALQRLLPSLNGCPALFGRRFTVAIDDKGNVSQVFEAV